MELTRLKLDIYANKLLMLAGICCALLFLNINIFDIISESISPFIKNIILLLITLAVFHQLFNRDYYLQFLGNTVYPCSNLTEKTPANHDIQKTVNVTPDVNVVYWAAEPNEKIIDNPWDAYDKYSNSGVTKSDKNGLAILKVRKPAAYKVPFKSKHIKSHIHYRVCIGNGMLGPIETIYI